MVMMMMMVMVMMKWRCIRFTDFIISVSILLVCSFIFKLLLLLLLLLSTYFSSSLVSHVQALGLHLYQGGSMGGEAFKFTEMPLMVGVDVFGRMETLAHFDAKIPLVAKRLFSTANDNQTDVDIKYMLLCLSVFFCLSCRVSSVSVLVLVSLSVLDLVLS
jgi:hypothetical protein